MKKRYMVQKLFDVHESVETWMDTKIKSNDLETLKQNFCPSGHRIVDMSVKPYKEVYRG